MSRHNLNNSFLCLFLHYTLLLMLGALVPGSSPLSLPARGTRPRGSSAEARLSEAEWSSYNLREPEGPGTYAFGYDVEDAQTGNTQFREEERHPNGTVTGSYGYVEPDGNIHVVRYTADENGYRVKIENSRDNTYQPPKASLKGPTINNGGQKLIPLVQSMISPSTPPKAEKLNHDTVFKRVSNSPENTYSPIQNDYRYPSNTPLNAMAVIPIVQNPNTQYSIYSQMGMPYQKPLLYSVPYVSNNQQQYMNSIRNSYNNGYRVPHNNFYQNLI